MTDEELVQAAIDIKDMCMDRVHCENCPFLLEDSECIFKSLSTNIDNLPFEWDQLEQLRKGANESAEVK